MTEQPTEPTAPETSGSPATEQSPGQPVEATPPAAPQETPASPPVEGGPQEEAAESMPPVATPTDQPPPPGPQPAPTTQGTITNEPSWMAPRMEAPGGAEANVYLPDGTPMFPNERIVRSTARNPQTGQEQEVTALATNPEGATTGAAGQAIPAGVREMAAAGVREVHAPRPQQVAQTQANLVERYLQSPLHRELGGAIGRNPTDLGLVGQGHVVVGHMILMDAEDGSLHRFLPGARVEDDRLYVNVRNLPETLVEGDLARRLMGGGG